MARSKFSWHEVDGLLILEVSRPRDNKLTTWTVAPRITNQQLYQIFGEVMMELDPHQRIPPEVALRAAQPAVQDQDPAGEPQQSEEASKEQLAAKAGAVGKTGGNWFANLENQDTELPLYTLGHGGKPG